MSERPINLLSEEVREDPFPIYAEMRRKSPVCVVEPGGFYAVSRYADVTSILKDSARFSSQGFLPVFEPPWVGTNPGARSLLTMDPPEHTVNRALVSRAFSPSTVARLEPTVRSIVDGLVADLAARGEAEFVGDFAARLTAGVIGSVLTLDPAHYERFKPWNDVLTSITPVPQGPEHVERTHRAIDELNAVLGATLDERRKSPGDDIVSKLIQAEVDGRHFTQHELICFMHLLLLAGLDTTVNLLAKSMIVLTDRPDVADRLRAEPRLISPFIEEMLRYDPPTHGIFRQATTDAEVAGTRIPAGSFVMVLLASANRDEAQFPKPDELIVDRNPQGVAFGHGAHICIGMPLARLEARAALEALLLRFNRLEREPGPIQWNHTLTVRGPSKLPVRVGSADRS